MISVNGKNVVVTGVIAGETRNTAEARLRAAGARTAGAVTGDTDLLICGAKVGASKTNKAKTLGVQVIDWNDVAWDGNGDGTAAERVAAPAKAAARQIGPMLAKKAETTEVPTGPGWTHEIKWDGYRCVATVKGGDVHVGGAAVSMQSRSDKTDYTDQFPHIAAELATYGDCVLDGELVVLSAEGGSFAGLTRAAGGNSQAQYVVFDILEAAGEDFRSQPLSRRRQLLEVIVDPNSTYIGVSPKFDDGAHLLSYCADNGLEGIVSKRLSSTYKEGCRDGSWLKIKCRAEQEFVVVGYTTGQGARAATFGALVLAVTDDDGDMMVVGKTNVAEPSEQLALLAAFKPDPDGDGNVKMTDTERRAAARDETTWVLPTVVVQVEFQRWTEDGRLFHPSYKGRRHDKAAVDVVRES